MKHMILILVISFGIHQCQSSTPEIVQPAAEEKAQIDSIGGTAASLLLSNLQPALLNAISEGGLVHGITVCSDTAQQLTSMISENLGEGIRVKRTTTQLRNPANGPDQYEKQALQYYQEHITQSGSFPSSYAQKIIVGDSTFYRFYKPMKVAGLCLNCHGNPEEFPSELVTTLNEKYPADEATGYQAGDFRGLVSVTIQHQLK